MNHEWTPMGANFSLSFVSIRGSSALKNDVVIQAERFFYLVIQGISSQSQNAERTSAIRCRCSSLSYSQLTLLWSFGSFGQEGTLQETL